MKLPLLLLAGSLAANAGLLALFNVQPTLAPVAIRDWFLSDAARSEQRDAALRAQRASAAAKAQAAAAQRATLWSKLQSDDLRTLIARLRAAGFSPVVIRAIVNARLESAFSARMNDLLGAIGDTPFWKPEPFSSLNNPRFYEIQNQIYRDRAKALREILGDDYFAMSAGDATAAQRRQFGDLPKAKIDLIQRIADDYAEMASQVRAATNGITLPEDREKLALLEREKRADLAAILKPAELEDYEMRHSNITSRLRSALTLMNASEAEFLAIYRVLQPFADILYPNPAGGIVRFTPEDSRLRTEAQTQVAAQLQAALGEQRYLDYTRSSSTEYQNLQRLAQQNNLPADAINRAFDLRTSATEESMRIRDAKLDPAAQSAAIQALAAATKAKLASHLGPAADTYVKNLTWLTSLERGYAVRISPDGTNTTTYTSAPLSPPKK